LKRPTSASTPNRPMRSRIAKRRKIGLTIQNWK
jgi:hypothetical protein